MKLYSNYSKGLKNYLHHEKQKSERDRDASKAVAKHSVEEKPQAIMDNSQISLLRWEIQ